MNDKRPQVDRIPVQTRERIRACAEALGYRKSPLAASLSTGKSLWIGVVTDILPNDPAKWLWMPFFEMALLSGAQRRLAAHGYLTLLGLRRENDGGHDIELMANADIGGLILKAAADRGVEKGEELLDAGIPVVNVFPIHRDDLYPHTVDLDNVAAGRLAAELVLQCGARNPAYLTKDAHMHADRARGFIEALQGGAKLTPAVCELRPGIRDAEAAAEIADFLLRNRPDAVMALDSGLAMHLSSAVEALSMRVPEDLSIMGFDCYVHRTARQQRISSVGVSWLDAGDAAARVVLDYLETGRRLTAPVLLPPMFVPGDTTPAGLSHAASEAHLRALNWPAT